MLTDEKVRFDFLNVGNADAALVRKGGFHMLMDCADTVRNGPEKVCGFLHACGVNALDLVVITHQHADHTGGLPAVANAFPVKRLWTNYLPPENATMAGLPARAIQLLPRGMDAYIAALELLRKKGTEILEIGPAGHEETLCPGLHCRVFGPGVDACARQRRFFDEALTGRPEISELFFFRGLMNVTSLRLLLEWDEKRALLAADLYTHLLTDEERVPCTLFRAPHHGSNDSVDEAAMAAVRPEITVVSGARGIKADRPDEGAMQLMARYSGQVLLTGDAEGPAVHIEL